MPPPTPAPGGALRRSLLAASFLVAALGIYGFFQLGPFLANEDALQQADAIMVLSGTPMRRPLEAADLFLNPDQRLHFSPSLIPDMDAAVDRVLLALTQGERIAVYGDFDADGVTATALLLEGLRLLDADTTTEAERLLGVRFRAG